MLHPNLNNKSKNHKLLKPIFLVEPLKTKTQTKVAPYLMVHLSNNLNNLINKIKHNNSNNLIRNKINQNSFQIWAVSSLNKTIWWLCNSNSINNNFTCNKWWWIKTLKWWGWAWILTLEVWEDLECSNNKWILTINNSWLVKCQEDLETWEPINNSTVSNSKTKHSSNNSSSNNRCNNSSNKFLKTKQLWLALEIVIKKVHPLIYLVELIR